MVRKALTLRRGEKRAIGFAVRSARDFLQVPVAPSRMAAADAVRWLLHFAEQDLASLSEARLAVLTEELRMFLNWRDDETVVPPTLAEWQAVLRDRLGDYFTERGWHFHAELDGSVFGPRGGNPSPAMIQVPGGDDPEVFSWHALQAVLQVGNRLRHCQNPNCRKLFVARGRQIYCSNTCGNTLRVAQFRKERDEDPERRAAYLRRRKKAYRDRTRKKIWKRP
jgi:hypothetical protein